MAEAEEWIGSRAALAGEGREYTFAIIGTDGWLLEGLTWRDAQMPPV
jgi:hypothetical protein